jgi:hypothetical protein
MEEKHCYILDYENGKILHIDANKLPYIPRIDETGEINWVTILDDNFHINDIEYLIVENELQIEDII